MKNNNIPTKREVFERLEAVNLDSLEEAFEVANDAIEREFDLLNF
mgnify:CR=1 FL=1